MKSGREDVGFRLTEELKKRAGEAGIDMVGVTSAETLPTKPRKYKHVQPLDLLPGARAVVVAGFCVSYEPRLRPSEPGTPRGRFTPYGSRAFQQMDQHCQDTVAGFLQEKGFQSVPAPRIPIKPAVVRAGLGRYGRHSVVLTPSLGSWVMFSCFVTDAPLAVDEEPIFDPGPCPPNCRCCAKACHTGAITGPYRVNMAKCITTWLWGYPAPRDLRAKQENRMFGCGECLLACPKSKGVRPRDNYPVPIDKADDSPDLIPLLTADEAHFRATMPAFAMEAGVEAMRGNAVIALGNLGDPAAVEALGATLKHPKAQLRAYSAWSLGKIGGERARALLAAARESEGETSVREELELALGEA